MQDKFSQLGEFRRALENELRGFGKELEGTDFFKTSDLAPVRKRAEGISEQVDLFNALSARDELAGVMDLISSEENRLQIDEANVANREQREADAVRAGLEVQGPTSRGTTNQLMELLNLFVNRRPDEDQNPFYDPNQSNLIRV